MMRLPICKVYELPDRPGRGVEFIGPREVALALRAQLRGNSARAAFRSYSSAKRTFVFLETDMPIGDLTQHLLDFFENIERIDTLDTHTWAFTDADGKRVVKKWDDFFRHLDDAGGPPS